MSLPPLPEGLRSRVVPTGVHNRWPSIGVFGPAKGGKSTFLSSFPPPMIAIDAHDQGIGMYLPKGDPSYVCFETSDPGEVNQIVDWAIENEAKINSLVVDPMSVLWTDHMDWMQEELGVDEIKGGQWKVVKGPWNRRFMRLRRAAFFKGYSFRLRDILYENEEAGPGEKGKLVIRPVEMPQIEKNIGYLIDQMFYCRNLVDAKNRPTPIFEVALWGGRIPHSLKGTDFTLGKTWRFSQKKPEPVWDKVIAPYLPQFEEDSEEGYGLDPDSKKALDEMKQDMEDGNVGRLIREIEEFKGNLDGYKELFKRVARESSVLSAEGKARVKAAHEKKRKEFE